jgi:mRNA-degrading endonuclease YafQ of YafQ-DinJ toxin-antitoxin module
VVFEEDSNEDLKAIIRKERVNMNKERLDWIMSGLNKHALTKYEDHFLKAASEDFDKKHALTEQQEERLERLYKEKSQLNPNRKLNYFSFRESTPRKPPLRRPRPKE